MLLKLLKLNANEAIISGATATRRSGQRDPAEDLPGARAVDPGGLDELSGDRLQRAERDEEEVGERQPDADGVTTDTAPRGRRATADVDE